MSCSSKQKMSVYIVCSHRCKRVVIHYDHIGSCPLFQNTKWFLKVAVGNNCIVLKEHLGNLTPCSIWIAEMMLVKDIGNFQDSSISWVYPSVPSPVTIPLCTNSMVGGHPQAFPILDSGLWTTMVSVSLIKSISCSLI